MKILVVAKLSDSSLNCIIEPIVQLNSVTKIFVLRDNPGNLDSEKVNFVYGRNLGNRSKVRHIRKIFSGIKICRSEKVDYIIGVLLYPHGYIGWLISKFTGVPYIHVTIAGHREFWIMGKVMEKINKIIFRKAHLITVTGSNSIKYLISNGFDPGRLKILPNVIKMENFEDYERKREFDIVSISRLDKNKNVELLLKAVARLKERVNLKAIIAGDGPDLLNLKKTASELGIEKNILFPGWINETEKNNIYNSASIFVLCSRGEGFPLALLEAMACGCVPVVTDVGDISDVVNDNYNGLIVSNYNEAEELAEKIYYLLKHPDKASLMASRAKEVRTRYSFENGVNSWERILV